MARRHIIGSAVAVVAVAASALTVGNAFADGSDEPSDAAPLIIGGHDATEDYPFMVSMQYSNDPDPHRHFCGAAVIDPEWILTAGHCPIESDGTSDPDIYHINIGDNDRTEGTDVDVAEIVLHPDYDTDAENAADIALVRLAEPVSQTPIEIAKPGPIGGDVRMIGWGYTSEDDIGDVSNLPTYLQELDSTRERYGSCIAEDEWDITPGDICVDSPGGDSGTCGGDSGSPLLREVDGRWTVVGVTSRGPGETGCLNGDSVFTSASYYQDWIEDTIAG